MNHFHEMGLSPILTNTLAHLGFVTPTAIQAQAIPIALQQKDVLGSAKTGTGKTLSFSLPLVNQLLTNNKGIALILTPTRELAQQVADQINKLLHKPSHIKMALLIGGEPYEKQIRQLKANARIMVGTPGRIIDHLQRGLIKNEEINFLVLDETDRMFDMGFSIQLENIISQLPTQRQTLMFSATFPPKIEALAAKYMQTPTRVFVNNPNETANLVADNLSQEVRQLKEAEKYDALLAELNQREGTILIFVKTKSNAERLAIRLAKENHNTCAIHGDLRQSKREKTMRAFRQGYYRIMVATDIASRGLDVPHVMHVINYDLPQVPEDYVHRIGRTARAGATGFAMSFISPQDAKKWEEIQYFLNPEKKRPSTKNFQRAVSRESNYRKTGNEASKNDRFSSGGFRRDSGPRRNDGFRRDNDFRRDSGARRDDGFRRDNGARRDDGFRRDNGARRDDGFRRDNGARKNQIHGDFQNRKNYFSPNNEPHHQQKRFMDNKDTKNQMEDKQRRRRIVHHERFSS